MKIERSTAARRFLLADVLVRWRARLCSDRDSDRERRGGLKIRVRPLSHGRQAYDGEESEFVAGEMRTGSSSTCSRRAR